MNTLKKSVRFLLVLSNTPMNKTYQVVMVKYKEARISSKSSRLGSLWKKCSSGDFPFWPAFISFVWDSVFVDNCYTAESQSGVSKM